jgi:hypothetical protein
MEGSDGIIDVRALASAAASTGIEVRFLLIR